MTEIEGIKFETPKIVPQGMTLVFKCDKNTTDRQANMLSDLIARSFPQNRTVLLRDCELHAVVDGSTFYAGELPTDSHEVPGFHVLDLSGQGGA